MTQPKIVCVVPTVRPERHAEFVKAWASDFEKYNVTLVTVWDGEEPCVTFRGPDDDYEGKLQGLDHPQLADNRDLFCRRTDAIRNLGFFYSLKTVPDLDIVYTLDDDCLPRQTLPSNWKDGPLSTAREPKYTRDPIGDHLKALSKKVPMGWMNTAHNDDHYVRGFPYGIREQAPVMLSHGVWDGTPDFDGETQLRLAQREGEDGGGIGLPHSMDYYVGPIPKGVMFPLCGMNVMIRREALPYFYFAPMGADTKVGDQCGMCLGGGYVPTDRDDNTCEVCKGVGLVPSLNRFADIYMGLFLKERFDELGWACYTGGSTIYHSRASDPNVNFEQEKLGREWLEIMTDPTRTQPPELVKYLRSYRGNRMRYETLIKSLLEKNDLNAEEYRK